MKTLLRNLTAFCVALLCASLVQADEFEDAIVLYGGQNYTVAFEKFIKLASEGHLGAQVNIGQMYREGKGTAQNYVEAARWYRIAAIRGVDYAQFALGNAVRIGEGVVQDYAEALRWYKLAAEKGFIGAQINLGSMYAQGQGVAQDYSKAHMWYNLAAVSGDSDAVKNRDIVAAKMTPQQVAEAQKLARECQARKFTKCD